MSRLMGTASEKVDGDSDGTVGEQVDGDSE